MSAARTMIATARELQEEFDRWTFTQPGIEIKLHVQLDGAPAFAPERFMGYGVAMLAILVQARNTYAPDDPTEKLISHMSQIPLPMPRDYWPSFLRGAIHRAVCHEADEWLRCDGEMLFDPHKHDVPGEVRR